MAPPTSTRNRVARLREAQGLTRTQLAAQVGVTEKTVMRWETGATRLPEDHWAVLCSLFAVSIAHLLGIDDDGSGDDGMRRAA